MGQKKSQRLTTLKKLAQWKEQDAASAFNQQRLRLQSEQQQLKDLESYYRDYLQTIARQTQVAREDLLNYRNFCQQLAQTIDQGELRVVTLEKELEIKKNQWLVSRNKRKALDEMIIRCRQQEDQTTLAKEQKDSEEVWLGHRHRKSPTP